MAVAVVQSVKTVGNGTLSGATITIALTGVAAGNTLVIAIGCDAADSPTFTDSTGQSWGAAKISYQGVGTVVRNVIWTLDNANAGTHTVTFSTSGLTPYNAKFMLELSGTANPSWDSSAAATATGAAAGGSSVTSGTLTQANSMVLTVMSPHIGGVTTNGVTSGWTIQQDEPDNNNYYGTTIATKVVAATTAQTGNWTCTGGSGGSGLLAMEIFAIMGASSGGTSLTPGAGSISITGYAPTVAKTANQSLTAGVGALALSGLVPTVARTANQGVTPTQGAIAFTGYAPTIVQAAGQSINPSAGALTLTGFAPTTVATANRALTAGAGALTITGPVPTVARTANQSLTIGAGSGVLTGYPPVVTQASSSISLTPGAGFLALTGYAPTVVNSGANLYPLGGGGGPLELFQHEPPVSAKERKRRKAAAAWAAREDAITESLKAKVEPSATPFVAPVVTPFGSSRPAPITPLPRFDAALKRRREEEAILHALSLFGM